jgi:hypothetical protein
MNVAESRKGLEAPNAIAIQASNAKRIECDVNLNSCRTEK